MNKTKKLKTFCHYKLEYLLAVCKALQGFFYSNFTRTITLFWANTRSCYLFMNRVFHFRFLVQIHQAYFARSKLKGKKAVFFFCLRIFRIHKSKTNAPGSKKD